MNASLLLRFQESCPQLPKSGSDALTSGTETATRIRAESSDKDREMKALGAITQTITAVKAEAVDDDDDERKFHAFP